MQRCRIDLPQVSQRLAREFIAFLARLDPMPRLRIERLRLLRVLHQQGGVDRTGSQRFDVQGGQLQSSLRQQFATVVAVCEMRDDVGVLGVGQRAGSKPRDRQSDLPALTVHARTVSGEFCSNCLTISRAFSRHRCARTRMLTALKPNRSATVSEGSFST